MKYKMFFLFLFQNFLVLSSFDVGSPLGDGHHNHWGAERYQQEADSSTSGSEASDQDVLCNAASEVFEKYKSSDVPCIKSQLKRVIEQEVRSPLMDQSVMASSLSRIRSGDACNIDTASTNYLHDLIIKATTLSMQEQQKEIMAKQSRIDSRMTKKQVAAICSAASTLIAAVAGLIVNYSKSC